MKKMYKKPIVEQEQLMPSSIILAGSSTPGIGSGGSSSGQSGETIGE